MEKGRYRVGPLALPCFMMPVTQATALVPRHFKNKEGPLINQASMRDQTGTSTFLANSIHTQQLVKTPLGQIIV